MKTVSVIIPTFDRASMVCRALSSVLHQNFDPAEIEIIVVDDGSRDDTEERIAPFRKHISYIRHAENQGVSAARNTGIRHSSAPLVAFLDSDDYWLPEKLQTQVAFFRRQPECVACQTQEIWIRRGRRVNPRKKHLKPSGDVFIPSLRLCLVSPSAVMLKRSLLDEVGLFDESLPACEDYDLWLRISSRYPIHLIDEYLLVKEGGHSDQLSTRIGGLDRYRIQSLVNLIEKEDLKDEYLLAALKELRRKCRIYGKGCLKRGKTNEADYYFDLPDRLERACKR
ncbi:MAG: glycosyltransferase family 2 protein [Deltaproteobacteria bacterium]|nr:glycosyltransferase family 2 protein [Deltaproteobacteria bacterium]MBW2018024.1 glycosyltransferase family 2 protein [Deltaproteobacteria bacterium]MBW2128250.1 glycosyltransferase family 2 protein [Deltaproteobacteria bacterium]MBW2302245.1 glycosyltransferase family 2 protein [Deltaproteobacteria bacterium]